MTCKDCVHYDVCEALEKNGISRIHPSQCGFFKDTSRFIELPCKVGDVVYVINRNEIYKCRVYGISIDYKSAWLSFLQNGVFPNFKEKKVYYLSEFGKTVFYTEEEAKKEVKGDERKWLNT